MEAHDTIQNQKKPLKPLAMLLETFSEGELAKKIGKSKGYVGEMSPGNVAVYCSIT